MRNALAIFRKDVRRLWPQTAILLALIVAQSIFAPITKIGLWHTPIDFIGLLGLAWWYLIVTVIQQERIPGDRQYWLTRPFTGLEMFAAKAIFIILLMHLPLFVSHAVELLAIGVFPGDILYGLLWRQCLLAAMMTLPAAAVAAATRNLAQFVLVALAIGAVNVGMRESRIEDWIGPWWIPPAGVLLAALGAAAALWMLYAGRDIVRSRVAIGLAAAVFLVAMFIQADDSTPISMVTGPPQRDPNSPHAVQAWIRLEGAPPTAQVFVDASTSLSNPSVRNYEDGRGVLVFNLADNVPTFQVAGELRLTLYTPRMAIAIPPGETVQIPGIGVCVRRRNERDPDLRLYCFSPRPRLALVVGPSYERMEWIVPPAGFEIPNLFLAADIYGNSKANGDRDLQLIPAQVLARVRGHFDLSGARP